MLSTDQLHLGGVNASVPTGSVAIKTDDPDEQPFIDKVKLYLDRMQNAADDWDPPSHPIELTHLLNEYETLRAHVLELKEGYLGIRGYRILTYASYTFTILSGIAIVGTAIASYIYEKEESEDAGHNSLQHAFDTAQDVLYPFVTVSTQVATFCKYKWMAAKNEPAELDMNVREELNEVEQFKDIVALITSFHTKMHEDNSTEELVKIIKKFIAQFAPLDNYKYEVEKIISSFLIMIPREHPLRKAFENDRAPQSPYNSYLMRTAQGSRVTHGSQESFGSTLMHTHHVDESEMKRSPEEFDHQRSMSFQFPTGTPPRVMRAASNYVAAGEGAVPPESESILTESKPSLFRKVPERNQLAKLGLPMKTVWVKHQQIPLN